MTETSETSQRRKDAIREATLTLNVFTEPHWPWETWLKSRLPPFEQVFAEPVAVDGDRPPLYDLRDRLARIENAKVFVTSQKGGGKTWALRHVGHHLQEQGFDVLYVSMTTATGGVFRDVGIVDLLVLLGGATAEWVHAHREAALPVELDPDLGLLVRAWAGALAPFVRLPALPDRAQEADLHGWLEQLGTAVRSLPDLRDWMRTNIKPLELFELVVWLLRVGRALGREPVLIVENLDKVSTDSAKALLIGWGDLLRRLPARMVMTFPFELNFQGGLRAVIPDCELVCLRNVPVVHRRTPETTDEEGVRWFGEVLGRLVDRSLVEDAVVAEAARLSGGIIVEFGRIIQAAFAQAEWEQADIVGLASLGPVVRKLERDLIRAAQGPGIRARLKAITQRHELTDPLDFQLLNANLVVEFVNVTDPVWYDVLPILRPHVLRWIKEDREADAAP